MRLLFACMLMFSACTAWHDVSIGADRHDDAHDDDDDDAVLHEASNSQGDASTAGDAASAVGGGELDEE